METDCSFSKAKWRQFCLSGISLALPTILIVLHLGLPLLPKLFMQVVSQSKKNKILEVKELKLEPSQFRWKNEYQSSYHP